MSPDSPLSSLFSYIPSVDDINRESSTSTTNEHKAELLTIHYFSQFTTSLVCFAGMVGNIVSAVTFFTKSLRSSICSVSVASRCLNDAIFLLSTFVIQLLLALHLEIKDFQVLYEILFTIQRTTGLVSSWLFVLLVFENVVLMTTPVGAKRWNTENCDIKLVVLFVAISCVINISYVVAVHSGLYTDISLVHTAMSYCVFVLGFPLPFAISVILMAVIARIVRRILKYKRRRQSVVSQQSKQICSHVKSPVRKVTKMLIVYLLSMTFLCFPSYIFQFLKLMGVLNQCSDRFGHVIYIVKDIIYVMGCMSSSVHFLIFNKYSSNYRQALGQLIRGPAPRKLSLYTETENLVRRRRSTLDGKMECTLRVDRTNSG